MGRGRKPQTAKGAAPRRVPATIAPICATQPNGTRKWYVDGQLHREDGPAIERPDGTKAWFRNGRLHREDGPALEFPDGSRRFFLNGEEHHHPPAPPIGTIGPRSRVSALANRAA
jgi:hypothetical protein